MDLSAIQEILDTIATFGGAIGDFLLKPIEIINQLVGWFTEGDSGDLSIVEHANATSSVFGGAEADGADDALSSFDDLSSEDAAAANGEGAEAVEGEEAGTEADG